PRDALPRERGGPDSGLKQADGAAARDGGRTSREFPGVLEPLVEEALARTEEWLVRNEPAGFRESLIELYFRLHAFRRTAGLYDAHYATILEPGSSVRVRLFCLDPSFLLQQVLARGRSALFFSATLTPVDYYRSLLGGSPEDPVLRLPTPFPSGNLAVLAHDRIRTVLKARPQTLDEVVQAVGALVRGRVGNYIVYLPSYQYLGAVQERFRARFPDATILVQRPGMGESEREAFLEAFAADGGTARVGFAVLGGVFGEGIDLVGERLIGVAVVGVGLPQLCLERDLIRDYFQEQTGAGFDYAYTFPGMNRVLQAVGRVIRSETDRGVILLIDTRFAESRYRALFPPGWNPATVRSVRAIEEAIRDFWERRFRISDSSSASQSIDDRHRRAIGSVSMTEPGDRLDA
ncbi:MAG TPA: ATP-dependent DNA helicase, partial [Candidatus Paceibacterota bacterium]|nr:ATP-dependent DNA helicase [Candidatus Paceibacterota bacterium]